MNLKQELLKTIMNINTLMFGKVYTADEIKIADRSVGSAVEMIGPDGTLSPAPDGEYAMEDGFQFVVKDGMIESILGEEAPAEDTPVEEVAAEDIPADAAPTEEAPADGSSIEERVGVLESKVDEILSILKDMVSTMMSSQKQGEKLESDFEKLSTDFKALAKTPAEFTKTNRGFAIDQSREDRKMEMAAILGKVVA